MRSSYDFYLVDCCFICICCVCIGLFIVLFWNCVMDCRLFVFGFFFCGGGVDFDGGWGECIVVVLFGFCV